MNDKSLTGKRLRLARLRGLRERLRASVVLRVAACVAVAAATVIGCGWPGTNRSVRFNAYQSEHEMSRLPPLPTLSNGKTEAARYWGDEDEEGEDAEEVSSQNHAAEIDALWEKAEAAEQSGDLQSARNLLRDYLNATAVGRDAFYGPEARQARRNSAIDRLDAMTALDHGGRVSALNSYLAARHSYDNPDTSDDKADADKHKAGADKKGNDVDQNNADPEQSIVDALAAASTEASLRDNVAYLRAAFSYQKKDYDEAAAAFTKLARQFPQSEKCEAALYMAALSTMKTSEAFTGTSGDDEHLQEGNSVYSSSSHFVPRAALTPVAARCDEAWREARDGFARVLRLYPHGRYSADARGWLAYLLLRANDRAGALVEYYRLLGDQQNLNTRLEAAFSLTLVRHHASDDEMRRVEAELEDEPAAALAYAYHNIYNYATDPGCQLDYDYPESEYEADFQRDEKETLQHAELQRIVAFAARLLKHYPQANISGGFAVRLAAANLELGENQAARQQAVRALALNASGEERARALWVKGAAEERLRAFEEARHTLSTLIIENPQGQFTEGARRLLAMVAEDAGDVGAALEQYLILKYDPDVAYFIDVLMTPEQLAAFIESHKDSEKLDELTYALGVRYMRAQRWDEARASFARVRTTGESAVSYYSPYNSNDSCDSPPGFEYRCSDPKDTDNGPGVTARLLLSDLRTIDELQRLEHAAEQAQGDEQKAEALYQLASYLFESSTLLFYNPIAWHSMRHYQLYDLHSMNKYRVAGEAEVVWRDMQEHEPVACALVIYLDVARRFPQTRAARDALYTAAVCHERLSNYNEYWRETYRTGLHAGDRMVTYKDVRATYPDYQLPRGTTFWEPVTRTFHGGPGWASPPKPQPRPTRRERLKLLCEKLWDWLTVFWAEKARRWVLIGLMLPGAVFASYFAAQSRRLLRRQMNHRRLRRRRSLRRWLAAYRAGQLKYHVNDEAHALARRIVHQGVRLMLNPRGRLLLALNLLAHGLLLGLVIAVVKTLHPG